jgi:hypothetical protein
MESWVSFNEESFARIASSVKAMAVEFTERLFQSPPNADVQLNRYLTPGIGNAALSSQSLK